MSDAVEAAEVMLYCVSEKYKDSANCRLVANYAVQEKCDMIPLMVQESYRARGWLGRAYRVPAVVPDTLP